MNCKWNGCNHKFTSIQDFKAHVESHFQTEISTTNSAFQDFIQFECPWSNCNFTLPKVDQNATSFSTNLIATNEGNFTPDFIESTLNKLWKHVNFHVYHEFIKFEGDKLFTRKGGKEENGGCDVDNSNLDVIFYQDTRNKNATQSFYCCWNGCGKNFNYLPDLLNHVVEDHLNSAEITSSVRKMKENVYKTELIMKCRWTGENSELCDYTMKTLKNPAEARRQLKRHIMSHICYKQFACSTCGQTFADETKYLNHFRRQKSKSSCEFECSVCGKAFATEELTKNHMRNTHDKSRHQCPFCPHTSRVPSELKRHIIYKHADIKPFNCHLCPKSFKTNYDLNQHIFTQHEQLSDQDAAYSCELCNFTTRSVSNLSDHKRLNHPPPKLICFDGGDLKLVNQNILDKPYRCHICKDIGFKRGRYLTDHFKRKHCLNKFETRARYVINADGFYVLDPEILQKVKFK